MRLEHYHYKGIYYLFHYFNSIKVRLERKYDINKKENLQFQFHKGAIRTIYDAAVPGLKAHFNSIKVRLEPLLIKRRRCLSAFQFHKGAIRTFID